MGLSTPNAQAQTTKNRDGFSLAAAVAYQDGRAGVSVGWLVRGALFVFARGDGVKAHDVTVTVRYDTD